MLSFSVDTRFFLLDHGTRFWALNLTEPSPGGKATLTGNGFPWLYAQKVRSAVTMGEMGDEIPHFGLIQLSEVGCYARCNLGGLPQTSSKVRKEGFSKVKKLSGNIYIVIPTKRSSFNIIYH